jgi:hypothetical protein
LIICRPGNLATQEHTLEVHRHHPVVVFFGQLQRIRRMHDAGIGHHDVEAAMGRHGLVHQRLDVCLLRHVAVPVLHIMTCIAQGLRSGLALVVGHVTDEHLCAVPGKAGGRCQAQPAGSPCNDCNLVLEHHERRNPCSRSGVK